MEPFEPEDFTDDEAYELYIDGLREAGEYDEDEYLREVD